VVDDNRDAATSLSYLLSAAGFEVETCFDGPSALAAADRFRPAACVLDINMPGMDGYELARRIRANCPDHPPVLATVTAYADYAHLERATDAGFDLHFTKPADPRELAEQLTQELRAHAEEGQPAEQTGEPARRGLLARLSRLIGLWSSSNGKTGG
jgi:CheY-like chemotaxis protein